MKRLNLALAICIATLLLAVSAWAGSEEPINTAIDSSTWTEIAADGETAVKAYVFQSRSGNDWKWKKTATSTNYFTVRDGLAIQISLPNHEAPTTLFYAQTAAGDDTIEVFLYNWH